MAYKIFFVVISHLGSKLYHGEKYFTNEVQVNTYTWHMNLTITNIQKSDFTTYVCSSINALGKSDANIRLRGTYLIQAIFVLFFVLFI